MSADKPTISKDTVAHVARLARIDLDDTRLEAMTKDVGRILEWVDELNKIDVEGVEPLASVTGHALPLRDDAITDGNQCDDILHNAPESTSGFFVVPKVVE